MGLILTFGDKLKGATMGRTVKKPWEQVDDLTDAPAIIATPENTKVPKRKPGTTMLGRPRWSYDPKTGRELPTIRAQSNPEKPFYAPLKAEDIKNRHQGEIVFILGSGTSLLECEQYLEVLRQHVTIGVNLSYLFMESNYLVFLDKYPWQYDKKRLLKLKSHIFAGERAKATGVNTFKEYNPNHEPSAILREDYAQGLTSGFSSIYPAINIAYLFGASEIALLGVDLASARHFYTDNAKYSNNPVIKARKHFWRDRKTYPGAPLVIKFLIFISQYLKKRGIRLWNCNPNSAAQGWDIVALSELLQRHEKKEAIAAADGFGERL